MLVVKKCIKHGALTIDKIIKSGVKSGIQQYKCKQCMKESHVRYYEKNKEYVANKTKAYKKANMEKYKELNKRYAEKKLAESWNTAKLTTSEKLSHVYAYRAAKRKLIYLLFDIDKVIRNANK